MPYRLNPKCSNPPGIAFALPALTPSPSTHSIHRLPSRLGPSQLSNHPRTATLVSATPIRRLQFGSLRGWLALLLASATAFVPTQSLAQTTITSDSASVHPATLVDSSIPGRLIHAPVATVPAPASGSLAPTTVASQGLTAVHTPDWLELTQRSAEQLDANRIPTAESSRRTLESALSNLERFLSTSPSQGPLWTSFLQLDTVKEELSKPNPNLEVLLEIEKRFRQNYFGLEQSPFTSVRDALARFVPTQRLGAEPEKTVEILRNRLKRLQERLQLPAPLSDDPNAIHDLAQTLAFLQQGNQAPELISTVRNHFSSPNVRVLLSSDFLRRHLSRPVNESNPVNEVILGTTIVGQSVLTGIITPQLLHGPSNATLRLNLLADFASSNQGYNRSVVLQTQGSANIAASESIALTESGLVAFGDTGVDADLQSVINSIQHRLRIVRKIAAKQAAKQKPQADAIGEARLEHRIRDQFHQQLETQLAEANSRLGSSGQPVLSRLGVPRPTRNSWSTPQQLAVQWNIRSGVQLAADGPCPIPQPSDGVCLQLHQSVIGNLLDPIMSGRVLRSSDMDQTIAQFGELAKTIQRKEEDGPWAITMDSFQPVEVHLDDSLIRFRIRTLRLEGPDEPLEQSALIEAAYRVQLEDGSVQLHREGDINVEFSGKQQRGGRASALRTVLRNKFEQLFRPQLFDAPIQWSDRLPDLLKDLKLASLAINDGWMQITLK
jgi:hypothetical protein